MILATSFLGVYRGLIHVVILWLKGSYQKGGGLKEFSEIQVSEFLD